MSNAIGILKTHWIICLYLKTNIVLIVDFDINIKELKCNVYLISCMDYIPRPI